MIIDLIILLNRYQTNIEIIFNDAYQSVSLTTEITMKFISN